MASAWGFDDTLSIFRSAHASAPIFLLLPSDAAVRPVAIKDFAD